MSAPQRVPSVVWLELTSKCPFDCTFCSRRNLRGVGNHMPIETVAEVCRALEGAEIIRLNYSGESVNHPEFDRALLLAKKTGAKTELVTALASIPTTHLRALVDHGLDRISVSLHSLDAEQFAQIYRFSSVEQLREKIALLRAYQEERGSRLPELDFSVVAMRNNLDQLKPIAEYADALGVRSITVHPVIRRDPADADVSWELAGPQQLRPAFSAALETAVTEAGNFYPRIGITVSRPAEALPVAEKGERFTCEQNPFETVHILADGGVVPCEVLDRQRLGNIHEQPFLDIWTGSVYQMLRSDYSSGRLAACRRCEFRRPVRGVGPLLPIYGWHERDASGTLWSRRLGEGRLEPAGNGYLRLDGVLPPASNGANCLEISEGGEVLGRVRNITGSNLVFSVEVPLGEGQAGRIVSFSVSDVFRPSANGTGSDIRELGFALTDAQWIPASKATPAVSVSRGRRTAVRGLLKILEWWDGRPFTPLVAPKLSEAQGLSVLIPARGDADLLVACLGSLRRALKHVEEVSEVTVQVNGSDRSTYNEVEKAFPEVRFRFHDKALGFSAAIAMGLKAIRYPWIYLLNSDMTLAEDALVRLLPHRAPTVFALGSRIHLTEGRTFETGWTRLQVAFGRAELVDVDPDAAPGASLRPNFYCGGGSSLFQTAVLKEVVAGSGCYDPFYWEDAEWGVAARSLGLESYFVGASEVTHLRRGTVNRFYREEEVEQVFERNRWLFQLRCLPGLISAQALQRELESASAATIRHVMRPDVLWGSLRMRRAARRIDV